MIQVRSITYDTLAAGRKVITFPSDIPFDEFLEELVKYVPKGEKKNTLVKIASIRNILERTTAIADLLKSSQEPEREVLGMAALAISADVAGFKMMYGMLLAVPPVGVLIDELAGFSNVNHVMERIAGRKQQGRKLGESDEWFEKKVMLLTMSHPLPGTESTPDDRPWTGWNAGVKRAVQSAEARWDTAIFERFKI